MPSTYTTSLRLELQAAGENLNTWGAPKLNTVISRIDTSIAGWTTVALTGNYTLTSSNTATDQSRQMLLKFTGTGSFTVTTPSVSKMYVVWNACTGDVTLTTGAGTTVVVESGEINVVICDGTNWKPLGAGAVSIKEYVDQVAWSYNAGNLPAQLGNAGKVVTTDGTNASWENITALSNYTNDQASRETTLKAFAIALAVAL